MSHDDEDFATLFAQTELGSARGGRRGVKVGEKVVTLSAMELRDGQEIRLPGQRGPGGPGGGPRGAGGPGGPGGPSGGTGGPGRSGGAEGGRGPR